MKRVGDTVILNGKRNKHYNGKRATIKSIHIRDDGKTIVTINEIEGLNPLTTKQYFSDQIK